MQALSNQAGKVSGPRRQWTARDAVAQHQSCPAAQRRANLWLVRSHSRHRPTHCRAASSEELITYEEVVAAAKNRGLCVTLEELGPFYTIRCRKGDTQGRILAETNGFVAPLFGLMHCDMLRIFTTGLGGEEGDRVRGGPLGLGLIVGGAVFTHGWQRGCKKAEILAINDDDEWLKRLVRYYSYFGFQPVYQVEGDKLADLPHMLVWGGAGMRMDADMERMLRKWTRSLRALAQQGGKSDEARGSSESGISSSSSADTVRVGSEVADKTPR